MPLIVIREKSTSSMCIRVASPWLLWAGSHEGHWTISVQGKIRESMSANRFILKHHEVEVDYTIGLTPALQALIYKDGSSVEISFKPTEITTYETALGTLISVPLLTTVDTGGERFGFFLPQLDVPSGQSEQFNTVGVYERFGGPDSIPHIAPSWRGIELHGTARTVIVPL
ncbi:MAG: hypothetical protein ACXVBO_21490 [Isosphaeraceae bacterium]